MGEEKDSFPPNPSSSSRNCSASGPPYMASSSNGCRGRGQREAYRWRSRSPSPHHPYEYITLPGGDRFDIPEGDDKQEWVQFFDEADRATREVIARCGNGRPADGINRAAILANSGHRDGSVYAVSGGWHQRYRISDRNESESSSSIGRFLFFRFFSVSQNKPIY